MSISRVLVLRNSVSGAASFSNKGVDKTIAALKAAFPEVVIVERDLVKNQVPQLTEETYDAIRNGKTETDVQKAADALATELIDEIKSVSLVVIGVPRYNFGAPATLKGYLDYIARPGVTFKYGANGPEGLLPDVPVWNIMSAGGVYGEDYFTKWISTVLPFIGLKTIKFLDVEGSGVGKAEEALAKLDATLTGLIAPFLPVVEEAAAPAAEETAAAPATEEAAPATEEAAPATEEAAPAAEEAAPATEEAAPATEEAAPATEEAAPATEEAAPATEEAAPATEEAAPATEEAAPAAE